MSLGAKIVRDTALLFGRSIVQRVIQVPVFIATANVLGPEGLGLLRLLGIVPMLAKYGSIDFASVVVREVADNTDADCRLKPSKARDVAYSVNLVWGLALALGVVAWSFFAEGGSQVAWGLRIGAASLMLSTVTRLLLANCTLERNFAVVAQSGVVEVLVNAVLTFATLWWLGVFSPLLAALGAGLFQLYWIGRRVGLHARFDLAWAEIRRQAPIAIPLALGTIVSGAQTWVERLLVGDFWGLQALGHFSLLMTIVITVGMLFNNLSHASAVHIYQRLGGRDGPIEVGRLVEVPTLTMACLVPAMAALAVFWLGPLIERFMPDYAGTVPLLPWMAAILWLTPLSTFYGAALNSRRIDAQLGNLTLNVGAVAVFVAGAWAAFRAGLGFEAALAARVAALLALNLGTILLGGRHLHPGLRRTGLKAAEFLLPGLLAMALVALLLPPDQGVWQRLLVAPGLFLLAYAPVLAYWEVRTAVLRTFVVPRLRAGLARAVRH